MYNICNDLQEFYDTDLRLGSDRRAVLAGVRDTNLERIREGLADLERETGRPHPCYSDFKNQGGYAMHTLNQAEENDYDIDVAVVFRSVDLPDDPKEARERICNALSKRSGGFITDPEARKNAVTVWYEDGYHVDFAIYRIKNNIFGTSIEHASGDEWTARDPKEVTEWFSRQVDQKSPSDSILLSPLEVKDKQMRRIVRYVKRFCKSRNGWNLPGGMVISTLVEEVYVADRLRDDISLRSTLLAMQRRLRLTERVFSPVRREQELTHSDKHKNQVSRLLKKLDQFLPKLSVLDKPDCSQEEARASWNFIFNHKFWKRTSSIRMRESVQDLSLPFWLSINCNLSKRENGPLYKGYPSGSYLLPKGLGLMFSIGMTNVNKPYTVKWTAHNEGDEAAEANQLSWEREGPICWTSTKYRGIQRMTAEIWKDDVLLASDDHVVRIA